MTDDYIDHDVDLGRFENFATAYHQLMKDLTELTVKSIKLIIAEKDTTENIYITGGFTKNSIFTGLVARAFREKGVYTSQVTNATALGAALVIWNHFDKKEAPSVDLGLQRVI